MVLGVATGASEAEVFWTEFLRSLADRGLRGVKLVIAAKPARRAGGGPTTTRASGPPRGASSTPVSSAAGWGR
jgi:hypothetical protein